jgi:hypothetical protein
LGVNWRTKASGSGRRVKGLGMAAPVGRSRDAAKMEHSLEAGLPYEKYIFSIETMPSTHR